MNHSPLCQVFKPTAPQKEDQHICGKWLIHGTEHCNNNQMQDLKHPLMNIMQIHAHTVKDIFGKSNKYTIVFKRPASLSNGKCNFTDNVRMEMREMCLR